MRPDWRLHGRDWPNRDASEFVTVKGLRWHVQTMGAGPTLLLLHGAGSASHSWRDLAPMLARDFTVIEPDLPGHGFTDRPRSGGLSLVGMAEGLSDLLEGLKVEADMAFGHSAGAALAIRMCLDGRIGKGGVVSVNGALRPFPGAAGRVFPAIAKLLFLNPIAVQAFAWRAARAGATARLIERTGSHIDAAGLEHYGRLLQTRGHIAGALGMMANWNLQPLVDDLPRFSAPLTLVAAAGDIAVPPDVARSVKAVIPHAELVMLRGLGHLAHEEAPDVVAGIVRRAFRP